MALAVDRHLPSGISLDAAYCWISHLILDLRSLRGRVVLDVHPTAANWQLIPVEQIEVFTGQQIPSLAALMADAEFAAAYNVIGTKLYTAIAAHHPEFAGATEA